MDAARTISCSSWSSNDQGRNAREGVNVRGDFKRFILRGNLADLAVAVVMGGAFGTLVTSPVTDLLTPLIAALVAHPDFSAIAVTISQSRLLIGEFLNAVVAFVLTAATIYFPIVAPLKAILTRARHGGAPPDPTNKTCPECLSEVPIGARRCAFCTVPFPETGFSSAQTGRSDRDDDEARRGQSGFVFGKARLAIRPAGQRPKKSARVGDDRPGHSSRLRNGSDSSPSFVSVDPKSRVVGGRRPL